MLKHVSHRSTTSIGGAQHPSRRASVPARPYSRQPSEGSASTTSTPAAGRRATHSPDMISSCTSTPRVQRRATQSPEILRNASRNAGSPDHCRRPDLRAAYRRFNDEPPPKLGRSMSTPAGCRYPPGTSPIQTPIPDSPRGFNDKRIASDENVAPGMKNFSFDEGEEIPNVPRSSTLPRRPMPLTCVNPPPLTSAMSYSALPPGGRTSLSGRSSSTSSLSDTIVGLPGCSGSKTAVRIHLRQLRPDIEYKTIRMDTTTTCRQLIEHLLQKLRLKHRDPNLFAVVLEVAVKGPAGAPPVKRRFLLEDSARPVELQQCRPRGEANFSVTMRRGGVLRVRDSVLTPGSQYKSLLVSYTSSATEVVRLLLNCNNRADDCRLFTLHESCAEPYHDRPLGSEESPLQIQASWPKERRDKYSFVLRRSLTQGLIEKRQFWRVTSVETSSTDTESELDDQLPMPAIRLTSSIYKKPGLIPSPKLVQKPNLMVTPCLSSNRSSISSTSSTSSSSSNPGSTGNSYFTPQNSSRVSCDSGFSSVASSPQPQTPPLRGLSHSPSSTPTLMRANEKYEPKSGFSKSMLNKKEDVDANKLERESRETECLSSGELNVATLSSFEINDQKEVPPPPPRKFFRNSNLQRAPHITSTQIASTQREINNSESKDYESQNSSLNLSADTGGDCRSKASSFTCEDSEENGQTFEIKDKKQQPKEELKTSWPSHLTRTPRPPPVTCRPTHLTSSKSTPIIREVIYKQVQSPSASSQYNTSPASSPVSQVSYASLVSDLTTPSPTASSNNKYSERHKSTSSTPTPTSSEGHFVVSEINIDEPYVENQNPSSSNIELNAITPKTLKLISSQKLKLPVPPAVPPRLHANVKRTQLVISPVRIVEEAKELRKSNCTAPLIVKEDQSAEIDTQREHSKVRVVEPSNRSEYNSRITLSSITSPSPSPPPPPLPATSPPPMIPKEARNFYFLPNINTNATLRRSSFPSTQRKENDVSECHSDPSSKVEISLQSKSSDEKISQDSVQKYFSKGEDFVSTQAPPQSRTTAATSRGPCGSSPALYTSPHALQAQKELQQAIDSLKHLTTHDLIYI